MSTWNVPNTLTVLRILLVPVMVAVLLDQTASDWAAAAVFALASVTDAADGYLARSRREITTFGKLMDPIADKLLIAAALVVLVSLDRIAVWIAMVIIAREFAVTASRMAATAQGVVIAAGWSGKLKTLVQVVAIFLAIGFDPAPAAVRALLYLAVAVTIASGLDYFVGLRRELRAAEERRQAGAAAASSSHSRIDV